VAQKILLIDDEQDLLFMVSHGLKKCGYEVFCGRNGREALALALQHMPDFVIIDVHLPVMDGDEVVRIYKKDEKLKHIPVFLISSVPNGLDKKAAACGADAYLYKPFKMVDLLELISKHSDPGQPPPAP
jgi:CheY-like chemotaxis protein